MITDLASLLSPGSAADLLASITERRRLFVRAQDPHRFDGLLPWSTINTLFCLNRFAPGQLRVVQASSDASPAMYRDPSDWSRLKLDALQTLAAQGVSIVINGIDRMVPAVAAAGSVLERHLRGTRWVNAYLSFRRQSAFRPHWDAHDVVVLHLHGHKRWRSYGTGSTFPTGGRAFGRDEDPGPVQWEQVLGPGDVLFLPRGEVHAAEVEEGGASVHLTVGIQPPRGSDVLAWLAQQTDEALRKDVSPHWSADELPAREAALKADLHRLVDGISLDAFFGHFDRAREHRLIPNFGFLHAIAPDATLHCALPRRVSIPPSQGGTVTLTIGSDTHRLTEAAAALLGLLQERDATTLAAAHAVLPAVAMESLSKAAGELARQGLIFLEHDDAFGKPPFSS